MRFLLPLAAVAFVLSVVPAARADVSEEPGPEAEDCSVDDKCPETGILCDSNPCFADEQCPGSGVECDWRGDDYEECMTAAEAAGLELRCDDQTTVYCQASEAAPAGSTAECHAKALAAKLEETCEDEDFGVVYCDPSEEEPGCAVEHVGGRSGVGVAFGVFALSAAVAALRARRRRA